MAVAQQASTRENANAPSADRGAEFAERVQELRLNKRAARRRRRWGRWLLLVLLIGCGVAIWLLRPYWLAYRGIAVESHIVQQREGGDLVTETTGYIVALDRQHISGPVPGIVKRVLVDVGDQVEPAQILLEIDATQYEAELAQAVAAMAAAQARLDDLIEGPRAEDIEQARAALDQALARQQLALSAYERARRLEGTLAASEAEQADVAHREATALVRQAQLALQLLEKGPRKETVAAAEAEVKRTAAVVDKAEDFLEKAKVRALAAGVVTSRNVEPGQMIRPEAINTVLFEILDPKSMAVEIEIQERDMARVALGQSCRIWTEVFPDMMFQGQLTWLAPQFNRQRAIREARVSITGDHDRLAPDMNCRVQVFAELPDEDEATISIPRAAVITEGDAAYVLVIQDGQLLERRIVELGEDTNGEVQIVSGLSASEAIVAAPDANLRSDQKVRLKTE